MLRSYVESSRRPSEPWNIPVYHDGLGFYEFRKAGRWILRVYQRGELKAELLATTTPPVPILKLYNRDGRYTLVTCGHEVTANSIRDLQVKQVAYIAEIEAARPIPILEIVDKLLYHIKKAKQRA
jgi:hypothetical protein